MGTYKILVVDDSLMIRKTIRKELGEGGYEVIEAKDGLEALARSADFPPPDLITLDIEMPRLNGFDTCSKLREERYSRFFTNCESNYVPVIFVTSNDTMEDRKKGFNLGAADFVTKPFAQGTILAAVNKILKPVTLSQGLTALVVDDSKVARHVVSDYLKREGLSIIEAENGIGAFEILGNQTDEIDMVITDLEMPEMGGRELAGKIRNELDMRDLPIIFLTGNSDRSELLEVFKSGATDHLIKPFAKEELLARITVHLERNLLTRQLRGMVDELMDLNRMKDNLIAVCSHDLRSPLNGILGFTDLLLGKENFDTEDREFLAQIKESGNVLLSLINDILDLSKAKADQVELKTEPMLLSAAVRTSVNTLRHMAHKKHQQFDFTDNCPEAVILGNSSGIGRVFNNLLTNAIKFTPEYGQINIDVKRGSEERVVVEVADTGLGIPEDKIPYLFDQFTQTSQAGTSGEKGTGLGMSIVKEILEQHNAVIEVSSDEGEGTSFTISFPWVTAAPECIVPTEALDIVKTEVETVPESTEPLACRILLVEDNSVNQKLATSLLTKAGYQVEVANNGREAVEKYTANSSDYDLIFMDVQMPVMDGLEATRAIRQIGFDTIPIIAMTANAMTDDREKCMQAGMVDHIAKPIDPTLLFDTVQKWRSVEEWQSLSDPGSAQKVPSLQAAIPETLENINVKAGLHHAGGNGDLYRELLDDFVRDHSDDSLLIGRAIENGHVEIAHRLSHSLKGIASTLGAQKLSSIARKIETTLQDGHVQAAMTSVEEMTFELDNVVRELQYKLPPKPAADESTVKDSPLDQSELTSLLNDFTQLANDLDPEAEALSKQIAAHLKPMGGRKAELAAKIAEQTENFEFSNALKTLETLNNHIIGED